MTKNNLEPETHVLLVDDEAAFRQAVARRLNKRHMAVAQAPDGTTCMEMLEKEPVDVVVLDVKMPGINGIETLKAVKQRYGNQIQVILLTGNAAVSDGIEGIKAGAFDYLTKPVEMEHLEIKIKQAHETTRLESQKQQEHEYRVNLEKKMINTERLAALGTMSTGIAHEINNPLAIINESAGFMKQLIESPEMTSFSQKNHLLKGIEKIEKSVKRARKITFQLLGHVRQRDYQISECRIGKLLDDTLTLLKKDVQDKQLKVQWDMDPEKTMVWSDPYKIRQVLMNLLANAVHASHKNGVITLSAGMTDGGVTLKIKDSGVGIPKENLGKLFDPFFTTKSFDKGTGLGLFVVHKIVDTLNGEIQVESEVGNGAVFTVRLPDLATTDSNTTDVAKGEKPND